jgi:phosphoribosylaminoimidazolecarboxamide formyltransferase/IMP cyclohydrolase
LNWPRAALFSLSDKRGVAAFARALAAHGTRIVASGGTAKHLEGEGVAVTPVEDLTGFAEMLGGRVKTLHPHVHAPILARRDEASHMAALAERGLDPIDLVAVTLYPFEERAAHLDTAGAIEEIDIGGVALLRGAAKNSDSVIVIDDPSQYAEVLVALETGGPELAQRRAWAARTFARTARYDAAIAADLSRRLRGDGAADAAASPPGIYVLALERSRTLRYGENPHQSAALYARTGEGSALEAWKEGKELSYNNLLDLEAAVALAGRFASPACVIVKHNQPCGAEIGRASCRERVSNEV